MIEDDVNFPKIGLRTCNTSDIQYISIIRNRIAVNFMLIRVSRWKFFDTYLNCCLLHWPIDGAISHKNYPFSQRSSCILIYFLFSLESVMFQYYIKIVPTMYVKLGGETIYTNQFSVTRHTKSVNTASGESGMPGVFFNYELSPLMVKYTERERYALFSTALPEYK